MRRNDGFTLIELLVTVSVGALVTFAAVSLLLLGARVQYATTREAEEQQTVRIVMSLLEKMAGSGDFDAIRTTYDGWQLLKKGTPDEVKFEYVHAGQTLYRGAYDGERTDNDVLLTGLNNAAVTMEGNLLRLAFETTGGASYVTRVYCRTAAVADTQAEVPDEEAVKDFYEGNDSLGDRVGFLHTLAGEYANGRNTGQIGGNGAYYSAWYLDYRYSSGYGETSGWNKDTPWCGCFVSWAAVTALGDGVRPYAFADVDAGMETFQKAADGGRWTDAGVGVRPTPGDYIFFDWTGEKKDPAHVGVVLDVRQEDGTDWVYTIEGNSAGRVAVRKYDIHSDAIVGYGVLPQFLADQQTGSRTKTVGAGFCHRG